MVAFEGNGCSVTIIIYMQGILFSYVLYFILIWILTFCKFCVDILMTFELEGGRRKLES